MFIEHILCQALFVLGPGNKAVSKTAEVPTLMDLPFRSGRKKTNTSRYGRCPCHKCQRENGTGPEDGEATAYRGWVSPQMARGWSEKLLWRETLGTDSGTMRDVCEDISHLQNKTKTKTPWQWKVVMEIQALSIIAAFIPLSHAFHWPSSRFSQSCKVLFVL